MPHSSDRILPLVQRALSPDNFLRHLAGAETLALRDWLSALPVDFTRLYEQRIAVALKGAQFRRIPSEELMPHAGTPAALQKLPTLGQNFPKRRVPFPRARDCWLEGRYPAVHFGLDEDSPVITAQVGYLARIGGVNYFQNPAGNRFVLKHVHTDQDHVSAYTYWTESRKE